MRPRLNLLLIIPVILCLVIPARVQDTEAPLITLKRTACFGTCPIYRLEVYADGKVVYEGKEYVKVIGKEEARISSEQVDHLVQRFLAIDYFHLEDAYRKRQNPDGTITMVSDLPSTFTSLTMNGRTKRVVNYAFAPEELTELEHEIERVVNSHQWLHRDDLKDAGIVAKDAYSGTKPGFTLLMQAAGQNDLEALDVELEGSGDVNAKDETGWTALMVASAWSQAPVVSRLLQAGADLTMKDSNGDTALIGAAAGRWFNDRSEWQTEVICLLLKAGADPNVTNHQGNTALMWAARSGNPEAVRALLDAGANANLRDSLGWTALRYAEDARKNLRNDWYKEDFEQVVVLLRERTAVR